MSSFSSSPAFATLRELATHPPDLTDEQLLTAERIGSYCIECANFKLLYATERVDSSVIDGLEILAQERSAVEQMEEMQKGAEVNYVQGQSKAQAALHTAMRLPLDGSFSFSTLPQVKPTFQSMQREHEKLRAFLATLDPYPHLIVIGIGGSELGPKAVFLALQGYCCSKKQVHFVANVDPDDLFCTIESIPLSQAMVLVISKSGSTLETRTNEQILRGVYEKEGLDPARHFLAVTEENSAMDDPSRYVERFYMPKSVGGRYSTTSMVGGVILSFAFGYETYSQFLAGAHAMDCIALEKTGNRNLPLFSALLGVWNRNFLSIPTLAIVPYSRALSRFTAHLQQCDMESNGKMVLTTGEKTGECTGPLIWGEPGTNGQHSFFQWIHQGSDPIAIELIGFAQGQQPLDATIDQSTSQQKLLSNLFAQSLALAQGKSSLQSNDHFPGNKPNHILLGKQLTPHSMGALLSYYEHKIAFQGFLWGINSFDQPGVQLGKVLSNRFLDLFQKKNSFPLGEAYLSHLS